MLRIKKAWDSILGQQIICEKCDKPCPRNSTRQRYCPGCSKERSRQRASKWARDNPLSKEVVAAKAAKQKSRAILKGEAISVIGRWRLEDVFPDEVGMVWVRRLAIDFSYALSKNHFASLSPDGHLYLRQQTRDARARIIEVVRDALSDVTPVENKVWIDLLVEKPNHNGDAVNVLDQLCDALKVALSIDDRWFAIRRIDWRIVKVEPRVYIGIGQEHDWPGRVCSYCGRVLPCDRFLKSKHNRNGVGRECDECRRI